MAESESASHVPTRVELLLRVEELEAENLGLRRALEAAGPAADADTPTQAWYRGAALMRATFHQHGHLADDDPLWTVEVPEYRAP